MGMLLNRFFLGLCLLGTYRHYFVDCDPTPLSTCSAKLDNGKIVDLKSLDNSQNPMVAQNTVDPDYTYTFNPCSPIACTSGVPPKAVACQKSIDGQFIYTLGDQQQPKLSLDNGDLNFEWSTSSSSRKTSVLCKCGKSTSLTFIREGSGSSTYYFSLTAKACCTDGSGGGGGGGLSFGSILLIIGFTLAIVYAIAGVMFQKFVRKSEGKDLIPNAEFWTSLPGLTKDGVMFGVSKIRGSKGSNYDSI